MSRRELFGSLCTLVFLVNLARVVFAPLLEPLRAAFGASSATLGLVATLAWLGSAVPRIPTGYLLTRVPRHYVILVTGAILTAAAAFTSLAQSVSILLVGAFLMGLASGVYFIAANPLVSELFPDGVGKAIGVHGTAAQLAAASTPIFVTGALMVGNWRTAFQAIAGAAALATAGFFLTARSTDLPDAGTDDRDLIAAIRHQYPIILAGIAILGVAGFIWNGVFNFYVTYLISSKGLAEQMARNLLTVVFAAGVPAFFISGRLADRVPLVPYLFTILSGFIGALLLLTIVDGLLALALVSVGLGYIIHSLYPAVDTYLLGSLPDRHRASAYAAFSGSVMIVGALGSAVVGRLTGAGLTFDLIYWTFVLALAVTVVLLIIVHWAGRFPVSARA